MNPRETARLAQRTRVQYQPTSGVKSREQMSHGRDLPDIAGIASRILMRPGTRSGLAQVTIQRRNMQQRGIMNWEYSDISKMIDHALLKPTLTTPELTAGCLMARAYDVASVCIMPFAVRQCAKLLSGSTVQPSTTIGFPHGASAISSKVEQSITALADGCTELDMVINISKALSGDWTYVQSEIRAVVDIAHDENKRVKVIFENCYLSDADKIRLCEICEEVGADWVKTSTGFGTGGARHEDLNLMRKHSPESVQVKASGGIRTLDHLLSVRETGVTRIGTSSTQTILDEARERLSLPPIDSATTTSEVSSY